MLFAFSSFVASTIDECVAPREYSILDVPGKNYTLKYVSVLTRHGARSPLDPFLERQQRGIWRCDSEDAQAAHMDQIQSLNQEELKQFSIIDLQNTHQIANLAI
ncbi:hypothetical protein TVAG_552750 [Trichomonas vaginalis G3]|uniref:Histidine acid phosphatase family protein n=1 Tax=Trichomonas vaginalis (strain ATCC PRA-98 / G3) TaxID=412133 RepID=A2HG87_TRIV3|nr:hypothetical protein TVAG_552750 [Trichomonas vaginalis G3]|eukprot:XP_001284510.1 hypothetical protein [Trichomonas vaginalis G3]